MGKFNLVRKLLKLSVLLVFFTGCVHPYEQGNPKIKHYKEILKKHHTKRDVLNSFGQPYKKYHNYDYDSWIYYYEKGVEHFFVPEHQKFEKRYIFRLKIVFNKKQEVIDFYDDTKSQNYNSKRAL